MPSSVKLALSTLIGILGWHGVFLLILIISFKIFHLGQDSTVCPCTWPVAFSTIMFLVPSLTSYMIAFFAYFRQDSGSVPWRALKTFYEFKRSCDFFNGCTDFDFHAELCLHCRRVKHDWTLVKIAVSAVFSLLYPLVWLIFTFLQANYYECAEVGPSSKILSSYCNVTIGDIPKDYDKNYALAGIRSKVIGGVLFVCMLFVVGLFVILYGEIENYMKKIDVSPPESDTVLAVHVTVMSDRSSGAVESSAVSRRNSVQSVTSAKGSIEAGSQSTNKLHQVDENKGIYIHLSDKFATALQGSLQDGAWQGVDIRCSQQEEYRSLQGSYIPFRSPTRTRLLQEARGVHSYESLHEVGN